MAFLTACGAACGFDSTGAGQWATAGSTESTSDSQTITSAPLETSASTQATTTRDVGGDGSTTGVPGDSESSESSSSESSGEPPARAWCDALDFDLVACFDLQKVDEIVGGLLIDGSSHGNDGTITNVAIVGGPLGHAVSLDASSQAQVPDSASLDITTTGTLEAFVRVDVLPNGGRVGIVDNDGQYSIFVYPDQGIRCNFYGASLFGNLSAASVGEWMHVTCVVNDAEHRMYIDGEQVAQGEFSTTPDPSNDYPMVIGNDSPGFGDPLLGAIGGVRVWSRALDAAEVCEAAGARCDG